MERFEGISIPAIVNSSGGGDGTTYELVLGGYYTGAKYEWWEEPPTPWRPLYETVLDILRTLKEERFGN